MKKLLFLTIVSSFLSLTSCTDDYSDISSPVTQSNKIESDSTTTEISNERIAPTSGETGHVAAERIAPTSDETTQVDIENFRALSIPTSGETGHVSADDL